MLHRFIRATVARHPDPRPVAGPRPDPGPDLQLGGHLQMGLGESAPRDLRVEGHGLRASLQLGLGAGGAAPGPLEMAARPFNFIILFQRITNGFRYTTVRQ
jgi:hypothetical protein